MGSDKKAMCISVANNAVDGLDVVGSLFDFPSLYAVAGQSTVSAVA